MLLASLLFAFVAVFVLFLAFMPVNLDNRPTLKIDPLPATGIEAPVTAKPQTSLIFKLFKVLGKLAIFNKPLVMGPIGRRMTRDLGMAQVAMSAQEFMLIKEIMIAVFLWFSFFVLTPQNELFMFSVLMGIVGGYFLPNLWLKGRMKSIKDSILRDLPDTVDLLAL